jgi:hypothetical protein
MYQYKDKGRGSVAIANKEISDDSHAALLIGAPDNIPQRDGIAGIFVQASGES